VRDVPESTRSHRRDAAALGETFLPALPRRSRKLACMRFPNALTGRRLEWQAGVGTSVTHRVVRLLKNVLCACMSLVADPVLSENQHDGEIRKKCRAVPADWRVNCDSITTDTSAGTNSCENGKRLERTARYGKQRCERPVAKAWL